MEPEESVTVQQLVAANRELGEACRDSLDSLYAEVKALCLLVEALLDQQSHAAAILARAPVPPDEAKV